MENSIARAVLAINWHVMELPATVQERCTLYDMVFTAYVCKSTQTLTNALRESTTALSSAWTQMKGSIARAVLAINWHVMELPATVQE